MENDGKKCGMEFDVSGLVNAFLAAGLMGQKSGPPCQDLNRDRLEVGSCSPEDPPAQPGRDPSGER
jgi:hypothetical protein